MLHRRLLCVLISNDSTITDILGCSSPRNWVFRSFPDTQEAIYFLEYTEIWSDSLRIQADMFLLGID